MITLEAFRGRRFLDALRVLAAAVELRAGAANGTASIIAFCREREGAGS
jgi:hypothetical protein